MAVSFPDAILNELLRKAFEARKNAYAPYSRFPVGAAILTKNGTIHTGCNIENSSFGLTICAERVALNKAVSEGERHFNAIAVIAGSKEPVSPCGACRQALFEFQPELVVVMSNLQFEKKIIKLSDLLPEAFYNRTNKD